MHIAQTFAWILGIAFIVVGLLGFFDNPILGLFQVDTVHNIIHLLSGAIAIGTAMTSAQAARLYTQIFGVVYGLVTVLGFLLPDGNIWGIMTVNTPDNILHLVIAVASLAVGFGSSAKS